MHKGFLRTGAVFGALSVALGAFGAHSLKGHVSDAALAIFETSVRYQMVHALALLATAIVYGTFNNRIMRWAGRLFIAGILLFSGSLYALAFFKAAVIPGYDWIGVVTPFGGLAFIAGWICLGAGTATKRFPRS